MMQITKISTKTITGRKIYNSLKPSQSLRGVNIKIGSAKSKPASKEVPYHTYGFIGYLKGNNVYVTFSNFMLKGHKSLFTY